MPRYLSLLSLTEKGLHSVGESSDRAAGFRAAVAAAGGNVLSLYWALGEFDGAVVFEAPDEETGAALLLSLGHDGYVRTRTMRVYDDAEFASIVDKI